MKARDAWVVMADASLRTGPHAQPVMAFVPSRKMTNKAAIDVVREFHLREYGYSWPNDAKWEQDAPGPDLVLRTPIRDYRMVKVQLYG